MARTKEEILTELINYRNTTALRELNSQSNTSIQKLWLDLVSEAASSLEQRWDEFSLEVESRIALEKVGIENYYAEAALRFQDGDILNAITLEYDLVAPEKRIVKKVSVVEAGRSVIIKVAKGDPLQAMSNSELNRLTAYLNQKKFAGINISVISLPPALLSFNANVIADKQFDSTQINQIVMDLTSDYLKNIDFGGVYVRNKHIAEVLKNKAIIDIKFNTIQVFDETLISVDQRYLPAPGYLLFDEDNSTILVE